MLLLGLLATALAAGAAGPDWNAAKDVETVYIVTADEDGSSRETKIWLVVVDGQPYIRTGSTRWKDNIERNPDVALRIDEAEYPLRAEFVTDTALFARVQQAFRDKYGFSDSFVGIFRPGEVRIMRLVAR
jgi:hypothetical protein